MTPRRIATAALASVLVVACSKTEKETTLKENATETNAPTLEEARNATYSGIDGLPENVTLVDGRWEGEPMVEGDAARPALYYARDFLLTGDLDGDGRPEAVALLGQNSGGSGDMVYIAALARAGNGVRCLATGRVGDRVKVRDARIGDGRIVIDVLQAGPEDAMCCPGDLVTRMWTLASSELVEDAATPAVRLTMEALAGVEWVLKWWTWDEAAPEVPVVTTSFSEGKLSGTSGCNRYFAHVIAGASPGDMSFSPLAGTRMACSPPADAIEARFLEQMGAVRRYSFMTGMLLLEYETRTVRDVMLFVRGPRSPH